MELNQKEDKQLASCCYGAQLTWNVVPIIFDVHLVQASLCGLVLNCDGAILIVGDVWAGGLARRHPDLTLNDKINNTQP